MSIRFVTPSRRRLHDVALVAGIVLSGLVVLACSLALWVGFIRLVCR